MGLQHSDPWRRFNRQAETFRSASTPPQDFRPFPWAVAFKHLSYNQVNHRPFQPSSKPASVVGTQFYFSMIQPSKETVQPSSQTLQTFTYDNWKRFFPISVPPLLEPGSHSCPMRFHSRLTKDYVS
nr:hypothetical transcript [Hymenolepis microstoma]